MTESVAVVPAVREVIAKEYADGDLAVRFLVAADYVAAFWQFFPDVETGAFVATEDGAVPVIRAGVMGEKADGSIRVRLKVEARHKAQFRELLPRPGAECFLAAEDPVCTKTRMMDDAEAVFGQLARQLRTHIPFMLNPAVWKAVGTEAQYREFLYQRPCVACGWKPYQSMDDWIHCEAAHVRRADDSGTAFKPPYKMIPLCPNTPGRQGCHSKQHNQGESAIGGPEQVDRWFVQSITAWVWETLKADLGYAHWSQVPPATLRAWAEPHGLVECLPEGYRRESGAAA